MRRGAARQAPLASRSPSPRLYALAQLSRAESSRSDSAAAKEALCAVWVRVFLTEICLFLPKCLQGRRSSLMSCHTHGCDTCLFHF